MGDLEHALPTLDMKENSKPDVEADLNTDADTHLDTYLDTDIYELDMKPQEKAPVFGPLSFSLSIRTKDNHEDALARDREPDYDHAHSKSCQNSSMDHEEVGTQQIRTGEEAAADDLMTYRYVSKPAPTTQVEVGEGQKTIILVRREKPKVRTQYAMPAPVQDMADVDDAASPFASLKPVFLESQGRLWL